MPKPLEGSGNGDGALCTKLASFGVRTSKSLEGARVTKDVRRGNSWIELKKGMSGAMC